MPQNVPPELEDKFRSCKEQVMASGETEEAAYGICYLSVVEGKSMSEALKIGARNNSGDKERKKKIREHAQAIHETANELDPEDVQVDEEKTMVTFGGTVKALPGGKVGGYLVTFGGVDLTGEYFAKETDFGEPGKLPVMYHHGMDEVLKRRRIGTAETKVDDIGVWAEAQLALRDEYEKAIYELAKSGKLGWSSGAAAHTVEYDRQEKASLIKQWYMAEASLTPTPAEPRNSVYSLKSFSDIQTAHNTHEDAGEASRAQAAVQTKQGDIKMDEMETKVQAAVKAAMDAQKAEAEAQKAEQERIDAEVETRVKARMEDAVKNRRLPYADGVTIAKHSDQWKYDNLSAGDQATMLGVLKSANKNASPAAYKALATKLEEDKSEVGEVGRRAMKAQGIKVVDESIDYSTSSAGFGDDWVGAAYSQSLWEAIRVGTFVVDKLPQVEVPQGMESIYLPLESTDPSWYKVAEATGNSSVLLIPGATVTASALGTTSKTLTLAKLGARTIWTGELDESSLIPFAPQLRAQLAVSGAEYLESAIIDGDTTTGTSANINYWGSSAPAASRYFLVWDGLRHSCLITTTANARSGGSLTVEDYLETVKLMGGAGINGLDRSKVSFVVDPNVYYKTLALPELLTKDVFASPTIEGGKLVSLWGYGLDVSGSMHKMSTTRKTNSVGIIELPTTTNNLYGSILAVRWDQWKFGWKRRMTMESTRIANADSTEIVAMFRAGLVQRDTEACAITFGLSV